MSDIISLIYIAYYDQCLMETCCEKREKRNQYRINKQETVLLFCRCDQVDYQNMMIDPHKNNGYQNVGMGSANDIEFGL